MDDYCFPRTVIIYKDFYFFLVKSSRDNDFIFSRPKQTISIRLFITASNTSFLSCLQNTIEYAHNVVSSCLKFKHVYLLYKYGHGNI